MEPENTKKIAGRRVFLVTMGLFFAAFLIYYSVMLMISPARKLTALKNGFNIIQSENSDKDAQILSDSAYLKLFKEKAFYQSRILMAETDSIYLTINLEDSTANIEISGVAVHDAKISEIHYSKILAKGPENIILSLLASPFTISEEFATIRKEPVMIKIAPKDTSEYKPDIMPDTSLTEPVNYILEMTDGTRVCVYQEENENFSERLSYFKFDIWYRLRNTWSSLKSVLCFKVPEYHLFVKIKLPRADAKMIYRALPTNGQVGIYR